MKKSLINPKSLHPALKGAMKLFLFLGLLPLGQGYAQNVTYQKKQLEITKQKTNDFDEATLRQKMKADGLAAPIIDKLIADRKVWMQQGKNVSWTNVKNAGSNPTPMATCGDIGGENGWTAWLGDIGSVNSGAPPTWTPPAGLPSVPNFSITSGAGTDPNTPGPNVGDPTVPFVCPGFGSASLELGEPCVAGCVAEQLTYPLLVTPQDSNFVYAYAIVIEDAGHSPSDQPFVQFSVLDQNGVLVPQCANFIYTGGPAMAGFYSVNGTGCGWAGTDQYKPWTIVGIDLTAYIGTTVTIVINNVDCAQCGHWAYSYWDFMCGTAALSAGCIGNTSTLCGPIDPNIAYTYQWFTNGVPMAPPQGTQQCISMIPQPGDTITVEVQQPSGCNFHLGYVPASIVPDFTYTGNCGTLTFQDSSYVSPASVNMTNWNWSFPGGTPSTSTSPTVTVTYNSPGTYIISYTVTCSAGCSAVATHSVVITALPTAQFTPSPACLGNAVTLTNASISPAGDPIVTWNWSMPAGSPPTSTSTNTSTTYLSAGLHNVTLTVTTQAGCINSISIPVQVYNPPVANFSGSGTGCAPVCVTGANGYTDLSTLAAADGIISNWAWSFPGGTPSSSTIQNPASVCYYIPGTYGATLIVTSSNGCKDTIAITPIVTPRPWPNANFCLEPNPAPATDPVFHFCDLWSTDVSQWSWDFGDGSAADLVNTDPTHSYSATVTNNDFYSYNVCVRVENQYGCWDSICKVVDLIPEYTFYIPNTFTPDGEGPSTNELFFGKGRGVKEYDIWIFDRWGNMIWNCNYSGSNVPWDVFGEEGMPAKCKWDGKVKQGGIDMSGGSRKLSEEDVYVWKVRLTDVFDRKHTYVGNVNVVK
ncbi:MAG: PKD domain-containing protein [Bacteroidetes bacterium]|nr:PKD domain-containing protein [Bacteroidota bacterium]